MKRIIMLAVAVVFRVCLFADSEEIAKIGKWTLYLNVDPMTDKGSYIAICEGPKIPVVMVDVHPRLVIYIEDMQPSATTKQTKYQAFCAFNLSGDEKFRRGENAVKYRFGKKPMVEQTWTTSPDRASLKSDYRFVPGSGILDERKMKFAAVTSLGHSVVADFDITGVKEVMMEAAADCRRRLGIKAPTDNQLESKKRSKKSTGDKRPQPRPIKTENDIQVDI